MSEFTLSTRSNDRLVGIHPDLVKVVRRAIELTTVDFAVGEGLRTVDRQKQLVKAGASQTTNSRHLTGHAVDLVAYIGKDVSWDWPLYYKIADAMKAAATELNVTIEWGGAWGRHMSDYASAEQACSEYVLSRKKAGKAAFIDGPHFQLPWNKYPVRN